MTMEQNETEGILETLQLAGRVIMENGGETYRVEETVCRMGRAFGLTEVESFAVPSGIFITCKNAEGDVKTGIQRVRRGGIHLERVDEVNRVSRHTEHEGLSWREARTELQEIAQRKGMPTWLRIPANSLCAAGFCVMFGGNLLDAGITGLVAALSESMTMTLGRFRMQSFASLLLGSFFATFIPLGLLRWLPGLHTEAMVAGALMPMLPGLAMTNAVQDTMRGDMISGVSHFGEAVLTAALLAGGSMSGAYMIRQLMGGA
ncbi:MAG: threonine/serine exporter family protein [Clostridia bacterium]|nr:threonine/serine exporter family protein [Clostridia bacterium]